MNVRSDPRVRTIHAYVVVSVNRSLDSTGGGSVPETTTPPFVSLIFISPSLALDFRNGVKDLNTECLISTGVLTATMSWEDRYGRIYVSWKIEEVIGKNPSGSFDNVVEIDSMRAERKASDTSAKIQQQFSSVSLNHAPSRESSFRVSQFFRVSGCITAAALTSSSVRSSSSPSPFRLSRRTRGLGGPSSPPISHNRSFHAWSRSMALPFVPPSTSSLERVMRPTAKAGPTRGVPFAVGSQSRVTQTSWPTDTEAEG